MERGLPLVSNLEDLPCWAHIVPCVPPTNMEQAIRICITPPPLSLSHTHTHTYTKMKMKIPYMFALATLGLNLLVLAQQDGPLPFRVEAMPPRHFKELGTRSKRAKVLYGPLEIPSVKDEKSHGHWSNRNVRAKMPCGEEQDCLITGWAPSLTLAEGENAGENANANKNIWLHHTGFTNLNRTDWVCENDWPERINVNGNERSSFDFTANG